MSTSDSLLVQLANSPDESAWRRLFDLYHPLLRAWLARAGVPAFDADDLIQEVLLVVFQNVKDFVPRRDGSFRAWLRGILRNRLLDYFERRPPHRPAAVGGSDYLDRLNQLQSPDSPLSALWDQEHDEHLVATVLPEIERHFAPATWRAFRLHVLERLPAAQVAEQLNVSLNSVLLAKSRVLKRLRTELGGLID